MVARGVGRFNTDDVASLVAYLADPLPSTELVLLAGGGRMAKSLTDALKAAKAITVATAAPTRARERSGWFDEQIKAAGLPEEWKPWGGGFINTDRWIETLASGR